MKKFYYKFYFCTLQFDEIFISLKSLCLSSNEGKIELVVFNLVENKESTESCDPHHVIHNVKPGNLFQLVLDTVIKYHNLTITTITSIPMKV